MGQWCLLKDGASESSSEVPGSESGAGVGVAAEA